MKMYKLKILATAVTLSLLSLVNTEKIQACVNEDGNFEISVRVNTCESAESVLNNDSGIRQAQDAAEKKVEVIVKSFEKSLNRAGVLAERGFQKTFEIGTSQAKLSERNKWIVSAQLVSNKSFGGTVLLKAFDKKQQEIGYSTCKVQVQADESHFFEFCFNNPQVLAKACYYSISC